MIQRLTFTVPASGLWTVRPVGWTRRPGTLPFVRSMLFVPGGATWVSGDDVAIGLSPDPECPRRLQNVNTTWPAVANEFSWLSVIRVATQVATGETVFERQVRIESLVPWDLYVAVRQEQTAFTQLVILYWDFMKVAPSDELRSAAEWGIRQPIIPVR